MIVKLLQGQDWLTLGSVVSVGRGLRLPRIDRMSVSGLVVRCLVARRRAGRRVWLLWLATLLLSAIAGAAPVVDLQLEAPAGCPTHATITTAIERLVQHPPAAPVRVAAKLVETAESWELRASLEGGERTVRGDSCMAVAEALVVIVALAVDPAGTLNVDVFQDLERADVSPDTSVPASEVAPALVPSSPPSAAASPGGSSAAWREPRADSVPDLPKDPPQLGLSLLMLAETGLLPDGSLGLTVSARYGERMLWGEFSASGLVPRFAPTQQDQTKGGNIGWFSGQLAGCTMPISRLRLGGCIGAEFGDLVGRGEHIAHPHTVHALVPALTATLVGRAKVHGDFGLEARLGIAVPVLRPALGLDGYGSVFEPAWRSIRGSLGFSWR
jgi:hypothetical protein